jgi:signal transduction histidine kinase
MRGLVESAVKMARLQFPQSEFVFEPSELEILADADRLKQVFLNLLINAGQAIGKAEKPRVEVTLKKLAGGAEIKIRDNGTGMSPEIIQKARRPLFTTKSGGSGLGLAVCQRIVSAHNGTMLILSDGREYTEITVIIPGEA